MAELERAEIANGARRGASDETSVGVDGADMHYDVILVWRIALEVADGPAKSITAIKWRLATWAGDQMRYTCERPAVLDGVGYPGSDCIRLTAVSGT